MYSRTSQKIFFIKMIQKPQPAPTSPAFQPSKFSVQNFNTRHTCHKWHCLQLWQFVSCGLHDIEQVFQRFFFERGLNLATIAISAVSKRKRQLQAMGRWDKYAIPTQHTNNQQSSLFMNCRQIYNLSQFPPTTAQQMSFDTAKPLCKRKVKTSID